MWICTRSKPSPQTSHRRGCGPCSTRHSRQPSACATTAPGTKTATDTGVVQVVAAENFWGSLAAQLGGTHASVHAIITSPDADPHDYEPTAADAVAIHQTQLAIINGVGYDGWATKLVAANPSDTRTVLTVGDLVGVAPGGNPHRWYDPDNVRTVIDQITADYKRIDPADAAYFDTQHDTVLRTNLKQYFDLINEIKTDYAGTPVGASESIFALLAAATGLNLLTPESFLDAISEGSEPTAADKVTIDKQIKDKHIKVYVYNRQNATPDVQAQVDRGEGGRDPGHHDHRDADAGRGHVPGLAGCSADRADRGAEDRDELRFRDRAGPTTRSTGRWHGRRDVVDATVTLGGRTIWSNLTATVAAGEFVAVLGPNGVGKSTLLKAILGLQPLTSGHIDVLGVRQNRPAAYPAAVGARSTATSATCRSGARSTPACASAASTWCGWASTATGGGSRCRGAPRGPPPAGSTSWSSWSAPRAYARRPIGTLSGGEQQRLLIAAALAHRPKVLLLDEPLDSLDLPNQAAVAALIARICRTENVAVMMVAHDVNPILCYLDRVIYLAAGGAIAGTPAEVITSECLTGLYGTPIEVLKTSDGRLVVVGSPEVPAVHADRHRHGDGRVHAHPHDEGHQ